MKALYKIIFSGLIILIAPSCTKELNLDPISQISNNKFWKTENDARGAMYGMYARLRTETSSNLFLLGDARSEILGRSLAAASNEQYYTNSLTSADPGPAWTGLYRIIHDANLILKYVPGITFSSEAAKNNILAQAYSTRAYVYFVITRTWGDATTITEPTEGYDSETNQKARAPQAEVFKLIKEDIEKALNLFPDNNFTTGRNIWSKPATQALKGDVHLWTAKRLNGGAADFNTALTALTEVEKADVALLANFESIFDYTNKGNKEILMATRFQEIEVTAHTIHQNMYISSVYMPVNADPESKQAIGVLGGAPFMTISNTARTQFANDDLRKKPTFVEIFTVNATTSTRTFYGSAVLKFNGFVNSGGVRMFLDDIILYRFADVLLMKAEAKNGLGQDPSTEMNLVRQRAYGPNFSNRIFVRGSREQNDAAILQERLFELIFEGKRWWDLIRFGKAFDLVPSLQSRKGQDHLLLFPISDVTLSLEPNVRQNPGY